MNADIISFGDVSKTIVYPLVLAGVCFISTFLQTEFMGINTIKNNIKYSFRDHVMLYETIPLFFYLINGLLLCIQQKRQKETSTSLQKQALVLHQFANDAPIDTITAEKLKKNLYWHMFLFTMLNKAFLIFACVILYPEQNASGDIFKLFEVIANIYLTKYFFNFPFFRHHYTGICIMILSITFTQIILSLAIASVKYNFFDSLILIISYILHAVSFVYQKWIIATKYTSPNHFLFLECCFGLAENLFIILVFSFVPCGNIGKYRFVGFCKNHDTFIDIPSFFYEIGQHKSRLIFLLIFYGIATYILEVLTVMTLYNYNPIFRSLPDMIVFVFLFIEYLIKGYITGTPLEKFIYTILAFVFYFLAIIAVLMFLEIIIVRICGLEENTRTEILKRAYHEATEVEQFNIQMGPDNPDISRDDDRSYRTDQGDEYVF